MNISKQKLNEANLFIQNNRSNINKKYLQRYHLTPQIGWMNDPNGFVYYKNEYHMFYQFHPYSSEWGPMHWGHAVSKDLINWRHLDIALAPGDEYDNFGCFSGTSIIDNGKLHLFYTGGKMLSDNVAECNQVQCLASSIDGNLFEKNKKNPVIAENELPSFADIKNFRDPKILKHDDTYYCIVASKSNDNTGQLLLFESSDMVKWTFKSVLLKGTEDQGIMWECPDIFSIGDKDIIIVSPIQMKMCGNKFANISSTVYFVGKVDWIEGKFYSQKMDEIDFGLDFYAPQTTIDDEGRRIMMAWMQMWDRNIPTHTEGHGWAGCMTIPRELSLDKNLNLIQKPVSEIYKLCRCNYTKHNVHIDSKSLEISLREKTSLIRLSIDSREDFRISIKSSIEEEISLFFYSRDNELKFSREKSGYEIKGREKDHLYSRSVYLDSNSSIDIEIFLDLSSIEIFINDGEKTITSRVYPHEYYNKLIISRNNCFDISLLDIFSIEI